MHGGPFSPGQQSDGQVSFNCRLDRCFLELMQDGEEAFLNFRRVVESANVIMATYADDLLGDTAVSTAPLTFY